MRALRGCEAIFLAMLLCRAGAAQPASNSSSEIEKHVQQVTSGLVGGTVVKGDEHPTHSLADRMKELHVPGVSIAVIHGGKIEWARGFGVRDEAGDAVDDATLFQAASISKPVFAMGVLHLVQEGKLALDTDVNAYLTSWKLPAADVAAGKPVTVRELLTHTGGITVHGFPGYASTVPVPTLVQVLNGEKPANTAPIRIEAAPGSKWQYSGGGITIVQQAVIDVTHEPLPKFMHDTVLSPIGMTHSTYEQPLPLTRRGDVATPYEFDGKPVPGGAHTYPEMGAAGLWTTPSDLALYAIEIEQSLAGKANHVLSVDMTRQMLKAGMGGWGLGIQIGGTDADPYFTHDGANEGFMCAFAAYEKDGEGAAVMTNGAAGGVLADEVMRSVAAAYGWPDFRPNVRAVVSVDPKVLAEYAGTYELDSRIDLVISVEDGHLVGQPNGQGKIALYPSSESSFFATTIALDLDFVRDEQGKVKSLVLHQNGDHVAPRK